jgi:hypothetical protein
MEILEVLKHVSIHAPIGANLEEVTLPPNEFYSSEGGGFKLVLVFDEGRWPFDCNQSGFNTNQKQAPKEDSRHPTLPRACVKPRCGGGIERQAHVVAHLHRAVGGHAHGHVTRCRGDDDVGIGPCGFDDGNFATPPCLGIKVDVLRPQAQLQGLA